MFRRCSIPGCPSTRDDTKLHKFPKTEIGLKKWVQCINIEFYNNFSFNQLQKMFVCHKHFEKKLTTDKYLHTYAYPSLFTKEEIETGIPHASANFENFQRSLIDHNYSRPIHNDHSYSKEHRIPLRERKENINCAYNAPSTSAVNNSMPEKDMEQDVCLTEPGGLLKSGEYKKKLATDSKKKRLVQKYKLLSPQCQRFYKEHQKAKRQSDFSVRAKNAAKMSKSNIFEKLSRKLNPLAKKIFWLQIQQSTKCKTGRRYSDEEKLIALSIFKQSPKSYKFLQKIFILPSKCTINRMIQNLCIETGINAQIFASLKMEVERWPEEKKYCSLIFDEVALEPALHYDEYKDNISGFVELENKMPEFADHGLVFMIRGAVYKWQQPICFYFCQGSTKAISLKAIIEKVTLEVIGAGLIPVALISDQGASFRSALRQMQESTRRQQLISGCNTDDTIKIKEHNINVLFDPPHLMKGLRNNFLTKDIILDGKICKWRDIIDVYLTDCKQTEIRLLHKLNDEHVIPEKIKKMKVKNCTRVFSKTVAAALAYTAQFSHYADGKQVSATLQNTSKLISFLDDLFDSCNGFAQPRNSRGKPLRAAIHKNSQHAAFWINAIKKLEIMRFKDKENKLCQVPSQKNFITTLKSLQRLWDFFKIKNVKYMRPRYFNSDPIENFFGQVRAYSYRNNNPTCQAFKLIFRSLLITRLIHFHSESYNCENVTGEQILKLKNLITPILEDEGKERERINSETKNLSLPSSSFDGTPPVYTKNIQAEVRKERLNVHSQAYTVGWVIRKTLKNVNNCSKCSQCLSQKEISSTHKWISHKEFQGFKRSQKLTYPTENAVRTFGNIIKEVNEYLEKTPECNLIAKNIINIIKSKYSFDFLKCEEHKIMMLEYFLSTAVKLCVMTWCSGINRILKGVDIKRLDVSLPNMQNKALKKYKNKIKKKSK